MVIEWIAKHFYQGWTNEAEVAFARSPISCIIATENLKLLGFACYTATMKGSFGPTGVAGELIGSGIAKMLFLPNFMPNF